MTDDIELLKDTILDTDLPEDSVQRIHRYARDLAWGAINGLWPPRMVIEGNHFDFANRPHRANYQTYMLKWDRKAPSIHMLTAFGYITPHQEGQVVTGMLTRAAFDLLNKPATEPSVFISYRRKHSTALALLIEARLRLAGHRAVFVDKMLEVGGDWRQELDQRVRESAYFVVLIGQETFQSEYVKREVEIAAEANSIIIPIWHPNAERDEHTPDVINNRHEIRIERETADGYETAISKLLNRMGYSTY